MNPVPFKFSTSQAAAIENWKILESFDLTLDKALLSSKPSQLSFGSEFKHPDILGLIFQNHPLWKNLENHLRKGCHYPTTTIDQSAIRQDLEEALEFGNHKGVVNNQTLFQSMMDDEVSKGWAIPIPRQKILELGSDVILSPMNIIEQLTIDEKGNRIPKKRITHNQSMEFGSKSSLNSRLISEEIQDVMYGKCILRIIHDIVVKRRDFPTKRIFLQKVDYKSAYRRGHLSAEAALQTVTQCVERDLAFIYLRLTFGGAANPSLWGDFAEPITDLANAILESDNWDPLKLYSPLQAEVPPIERLKADLPFASAHPLSVDIHPSSKPKADIYIDDTTTVTVELGDNCIRAERAVLLAIEIVARKFCKSDPIKRDHLISISKLKAEAALEETKILLGWKLNTRQLLVSLPFDKYKAWSNDIVEILQRESTTFNELDSLIGRLTHVSVILSNMKHFMSRLRQERRRAKNRRSIKLKEEAVEDLLLHQQFLDSAFEGINMNLLTYRKPTHIYRADACPFGLGGYSAKGKAWRWQIPTNLQFRASINMLEHMAALIGPWIDILSNDIEELSCILSMTDNTSAAGWLRKSNFQESARESVAMTRAKLTLARDHAKRMLNCKCVNYSQWFPGDDNDVADSLSRDFHLSNSDLTSLFLSKLPNQTPSNFEISPIPQEIELYILSILQSLPEASQVPERHSSSKISRGLDGVYSSDQLNWKTIHSSRTSPAEARILSHPLLPNQSDKESIQNQLLIPWLQRQSVPPWTTFHRPSETLTIPTQDTTRKEGLHDFYKCSTKAIKNKIPAKSTRKRFHSV